MADITRVPVRKETELWSAPWQPFEGLRREMDRLFDDFGRDFWPLRRSLFAAEPLFRRGIK